MSKLVLEGRDKKNWEVEHRQPYSVLTVTRTVALKQRRRQTFCFNTVSCVRIVHIDNQAIETVSRFTYLGSDIDSDGYPTQRYTDAWASLAPLWLNLTKSGVSKDSVSPPSSEYTPLLCSR